MGEHVDLYRVELKNRQHVFIARVELGPGGTFHIDAEASDVEKRLRHRLDAAQPATLEDLTKIFDAPHLMATKPHEAEFCLFQQANVVPLRTRAAAVQFVDA